MKSVRYTIWILGVLLVMATLDSLPDPPAVNPSTAPCKILVLHDVDASAVTPLRAAPVAPTSYPVSLVAADWCEPNRTSDWIVGTGQAADPSPPSALAWA